MGWGDGTKGVKAGGGAAVANGWGFGGDAAGANGFLAAAKGWGGEGKGCGGMDRGGAGKGWGGAAAAWTPVWTVVAGSVTPVAAARSPHTSPTAGQGLAEFHLPPTTSWATPLSNPGNPMHSGYAPSRSQASQQYQLSQQPPPGQLRPPGQQQPYGHSLNAASAMSVSTQSLPRSEVRAAQQQQKQPAGSPSTNWMSWLTTECGDEWRPPQASTFGIDSRFLLPLVLFASTFLGSVCVWLVQVPMLQESWGIPAEVTKGACLFLYGATLALMAYCAFFDPGQLRPEQASPQGNYMKVEAGTPHASVPPRSESEDFANLPRRAHKAWQYKLPIRRYDHYCRWVTNCIGLLNHREFFVMCVGLVAIAVIGMVLDLVLAVALCFRGWDTVDVSGDLLPIVLHGAYSGILLYSAGPILRLHAGLVGRNELACEWKHDEFYIAASAKRGMMVPAPDLSDDEYNDLVDHFVYDPSRNRWDHGWRTNCWNFWCTPRWKASELGEF